MNNRFKRLWEIYVQTNFLLHEKEYRYILLSATLWQKNFWTLPDAN